MFLQLYRMYFNSIKVQLKQAHFNVNVSSLMSFQFHKGTIKTLGYEEVDPRLLLFQFHKGTIKTFSYDASYPCSYYFNSIKVQLKH